VKADPVAFFQQNPGFWEKVRKQLGPKAMKERFLNWLDQNDDGKRNLGDVKAWLVKAGKKLKDPAMWLKAAAYALGPVTGGASVMLAQMANIGSFARRIDKALGSSPQPGEPDPYAHFNQNPSFEEQEAAAFQEALQDDWFFLQNAIENGDTGGFGDPAGSGEPGTPDTLDDPLGAGSGEGAPDEHILDPFGNPIFGVEDPVPPPQAAPGAVTFTNDLFAIENPEGVGQGLFQNQDLGNMFALAGDQNFDPMSLVGAGTGPAPVGGPFQSSGFTFNEGAQLSAIAKMLGSTPTQSNAEADALFFANSPDFIKRIFNHVPPPPPPEDDDENGGD
jgi:hypothetical protein